MTKKSRQKRKNRRLINRIEKILINNMRVENQLILDRSLFGWSAKRTLPDGTYVRIDPCLVTASTPGIDYVKGEGPVGELNWAPTFTIGYKFID